MLDGVQLAIGDVVFVLGIGAGTVVRIESDGGFTVRTGNGQQHYRAGGKIGNVRKVFWHDPLLVIPPRDLRLWNAFKAMAQSNYAQLVALFKSGAIPDAE